MRPRKWNRWLKALAGLFLLLPAAVYSKTIVHLGGNQPVVLRPQALETGHLLPGAKMKPSTDFRRRVITVKGFDTPAIVLAIGQSQPGDTVKLPAGIYTISEAIKPKSRTRLVGAGQDRTMVRFTGDKPGSLVDLSNNEKVEVAHLTLEGANNPSARQGISAHNARWLKIHHLTIRNLVKGDTSFIHGILFAGTNPTRENGVTDSMIADCLVENIGVGAEFGGGIRLSWGSSRNRVLRNTIRNTGRGGIFGDNGSNDLVIQKNTVSGSGGEGLGIEVWGDCRRAVIEDNHIDHWLSVGGCDDCAVRRNVISDKTGTVKFCGLEIIGSRCVVTDNLVDDGQQIGISVSGMPVKYVFYKNNTIRNCIQWGAQLQGDGAGIASHYFYRCRFLNTSVGRGQPWYPGDEGHGFRLLSRVRHITLEDCEFRDNGRLGIQLVGDKIDSLSFVRCAIKGNRGAAVAGPSHYTALEWIRCTAKGNGSNNLPPARPFPRPAPKAAFDAPAVAHTGEPVTFVSRSKADGSAVVLWDFGDGAPATGARVTHIYPSPGSYRVSMVVWDAAGRGSRMEKRIRVTEKQERMRAQCPIAGSESASSVAEAFPSATQRHIGCSLGIAISSRFPMSMRKAARRLMSQFDIGQWYPNWLDLLRFCRGDRSVARTVIFKYFQGRCQVLTRSQLDQFCAEGYLLLGQVVSDEEVEALRRRADDIMQGRVRYEGMFFQLDAGSTEYKLLPGGDFQGPSDNYRKIEGWEKDPLYLAYIQHSLFRELTRILIGEHISIYRAMFMNKPAQRGTYLPYHQDGGSQWQLSENDGDKFLTIWTALDDATIENGCVQVVPGTHKLGLLSERGHTITEEQERLYAPEERSRYIELKTGEVFVMHNFLLHRSGVNRTDQPRRGFSVCYMDASIRRIDDPNHRFPVVFGEGALTPQAVAAR